MAQTTVTIDPYDLLKNAYEGAGGFKDGSYLFQHKRETAPNFEVRKSIAYYLNYLQPVVNTHVDPIFRKEPARNWSNSKFLDAFVTDVDGLGTPFTTFMKRSGFAAKLMGVSLIVMDNVSDTSQAVSIAQAKEKRQFPYCYMVSADRIFKWKTDSFGKLQYIVYSEPLVNKDAEEPKATDVAATFKDTAGASEIQYRIWTTTDWAVCDKDGEILDSGEHGLGRVPVTLLYSKSVIPGQVLVESEFASIAKTNLRLFNLCSELDEILRNQAFSVLIYPSKDPTSLTIGVNNALGFDGVESRFAPDFIAPPAAPAEMLMGQMDRLIQEMYRMAMLSHVTGDTQSRTGAAKQWDFEATNKVLASFSGNCAAAEMDLMNIFALWTKTDPIKQNFTSRYSSDFSIRDTVQDIEEATKALAMKIGGRYDIEIKKKVASATLKDVPDADVQAVIAEINTGTAVVVDTAAQPADTKPAAEAS